ncbi:MAG TPA: sulfotransferase [Solirubrobacteraceae bacterium]|jgi:hypothetical protein|nr:sulfotransferase [Solirubrobacteraceae bacterium]
MKVIGVGMPRTGTLTQKVALEKLGAGPCYHMVDVIADLDRVQHWLAALDGAPDWDTTFDGFQATVDVPGAYFCRGLLERYPDAKFVLSVRDPEQWAASMRGTVWDFANGDSPMSHLSYAHAHVNPRWASFVTMLKRLLWDEGGMLHEARDEPDRLPELFERWTVEVREAVPAAQLLEWSASEGWGPLCEFLGVPEPDTPMPHVNDAQTFITRIIDGALGTLNGWWERERPAI